MITGNIDINVVAMVALAVAALVVLRKFNVITPDEWLRGLAAEAKELVQLKVTTGAVNFATLLVLMLMVGLYFIAPELAAFFERMASPGADNEGSKTVLFVVMITVLAIVMLLCLRFQRSK